MREFSFLIHQEKSLEGQWVAHCLNLDLVSQGNSPAHAIRMILEATSIAVLDDLEAGLDPAGRPSAPKELWDLFARTQQTGTRVAAPDVDRLPSASKHLVIALVAYMGLLGKSDERRAEDLSNVPPPFVIATLQNGENAVCC